MTKTTGYMVKMIEKGGRPLSLAFPKTFTDGKCEREMCFVCKNPDIKGPSLCQVRSVVYQGVCVTCDKNHKEDGSRPHMGMYISETYRTLAERAEEHFAALKRFDFKSFMYKHWTLQHPECDSPPEFRFKVLKVHKDPMTRLIHEAERIYALRR